ncbi:unnamed protein product, partial [Closterium sp. NIES-53]
MREVLTDQQAAVALYAHVKGEVEAGIEYLLRKREEDPYADLGARLLYEATWGGERQAPTFKPPSRVAATAALAVLPVRSQSPQLPCPSPPTLASSPTLLSPDARNRSTRTCPLPPQPLHINAKPCCYYSSGSLARALSLTAAATPLSTHTPLLFPRFLRTSVRKLANAT